VTGAAANVGEPYLDGSVRPDILFPAYVSGLNLAEAFYLALPSLSWQSVVIGDPLCAPFRPPALVAENTNPPVDPDTELPALFSARRVAVSAPRSGPGLKPIVQAETRLAHDDAAGAVESLKRAVALEPSSVVGWRSLGVALELLHKPGDARDAYSRVLDLDRNDVVALNNLAFITAVYDKRPADALPLAARAATLDSHNALVQDTLGWIHHLLGENQEAAKLLAGARQSDPDQAEIQLHSAVVLDLIGRRDEATKALQAAEALDASLKDRPEVQELRRRLMADTPSKG
jgi:Flp pilus assembly protein TadD